MRKPIQISVTHEPDSGSDTIYALCDDGTVWFMAFFGPPEDCAWERLRNVPQDENIMRRRRIGDIPDEEWRPPVPEDGE